MESKINPPGPGGRLQRVVRCRDAEQGRHARCGRSKATAEVELYVPGADILLGLRRRVRGVPVRAQQPPSATTGCQAEQQGTKE